MIQTVLSNPRPYELRIMACRICTGTTKKPPVADEFATPLCGELPFVERVFHKAGGEHWQFDLRSVIRKRQIPSDSIVFKLLKNGVEVATLNDNTLGIYFDTFPGTSEQALQVGFIINFNLVFANHSWGRYKIKIEQTLLGVAQPDQFTHEYQLMSYSDGAADRMVKIETSQNGCVESSVFDFTGLDWPQAIRIPGRLFIDKPPKFLTDRYKDTPRTQLQIQDEIQFEYLLETLMLPSEIGNFLMIDAMLSNEYQVTDYNLNNYQVYRRIRLYPQSIEDVGPGDRTRKMSFVIKFTDKVQNHLKRNVK